MGRGGARYGAGRPGNRLAAEQTKRIDIRKLHESDLLHIGKSFVWGWSREGESTGNIGLAVGAESIRLNYWISDPEGKMRDASQTIPTKFTLCKFGGIRRWFICPTCSAGACVLYLRWRRFACRGCQRISYQSQSGSASDRICNRYHRLDAVVMAGKPKWQRWATFDRQLARYNAASEEFDRLLRHQLMVLGFPELMTHPIESDLQ